MLVPPGDIDLQPVDRHQRDIDIGRLRGAAVHAGIRGAEPGIGLPALLVGRGGIARADLIHVLAIFAPEGEVDRGRHPGLDLVRDIRVDGQFARLEEPVIEGRRGEAGIRVERGVRRIDRVDLVLVLAERARQVVVEAVGRATHATGERHVLLADLLARAEAVGGRIAVGIEIGRHAADGARDAGRHADILVGAGDAARIGAEAVRLDTAEIIGRVILEVDQARLRIAADLVDVGKPVHAGIQALLDRVDGRTGRAAQQIAIGVGDAAIEPADLREVVVAIEAGDVDEPVLADLGREVQAACVRAAAGVVMLARGHRGVAALLVVLQDDVDDAGDRVGAILGGGPVLQHLDALDRRRRDQVEIGGRRALIGSAEDREVGRAVAALAVDQHERVVRTQPAQPGRQREVGGIATERLRGERRHELCQDLVQVRLADMAHEVGVEHLDRCSAFGGGDPGRAGAGDDDVVARRAGLGGDFDRLGMRGDGRQACECYGECAT